MPSALRQTTKKVAVTLPQHAKFSFLMEASELMSRLNLPLSGHLGAAALKVADHPDAAVAARTVLQLCACCGIHLNAHSISCAELRPLSKRGQKRSSTGQTLAPGQKNCVAIHRVCKVCGHRNLQPFISALAAQRMFDTEAAELQKMQLVQAQAASRQDKETLLAHSTGLQAPGDVLKAPTHLIPANLNSAINLLQSCPNSYDTLSHHQRQEEESAMLCPCLNKLINSQSQVDSRPLLDASATGAVRVQEETKAQGESVDFQDKTVLPGPTENSGLSAPVQEEVLEGSSAHAQERLTAGPSPPEKERLLTGPSAHAQERLTAGPSAPDKERLLTGPSPSDQEILTAGPSAPVQEEVPIRPSAHAQNADIRELNQNSKALSDYPPSGTPTWSSKFCETAEVHLASTSHASCRSGIAEVIVKSEHDHPTLIASCTQNACDVAPGDSQPLEEVPPLPITMSPEALQCCAELAMTFEEAFCDGVSATDTDTGVACPTYVTHHDPPNKSSAVEHDAAAENCDSGKHALDYETNTEAEVGGGPKINSGGRADKQCLQDDALLRSYEDHGPDDVIIRDGKLSPRNDIIKLLIPDTSMINGTEVDSNKLRCSQTVKEQQYSDPCGDNVEGNSCKAECTSEEECRSPSESHIDDDVLSLVQQGFAVKSGAGVADKLGGRTSGRRVQVNPALNGRERWGLHVDPFFVAHHPWYIKPFSAKYTILRIQAKETKKRGR